MAWIARKGRRWVLSVLVAGCSASAACSPGACKRVFVTSKVLAPSGKLGGLEAADKFCQAAAASFGAATWKAWLSDATASTSARFTRANVPYMLFDGNVIATNWASL